ncbi:hypothetical protein BY458DRAFT_433618 [Sporodiniella umbellata]|nr:hypothetical protein BY458DRAFT_433618 [Sporodiniella umbellata]
MGVDRFMILKYLRMGMVTFSLYSLVAIPILFPLITVNQGHLEGLNFLTMGNVTNSNRTWAHCFLAILLSGLVWYYTFHETYRYIDLRRKFLLSPEYTQSVAARTLFVPSIPSDVNQAEEIKRIFRQFPGGVRRVWLNRQLDSLPDLVQERDQAIQKLEKAMTKAIVATCRKKGELPQEEEAVDLPGPLRPTHRLGWFWGRRVDSIQYYQQQIQKLNQTISEKQKEAPQLAQCNSAFVEFRQQVACHMAAQSLIHKEAMQMAPRHIAIEPSDIIWENMNIRSFERLVRRFISIVVTTAIVVFWAVPVVFVQAIANLEKLSEVIPFLKGLDRLGPSAIGIIQGILPAIALSILISLVPVIFTFLSKSEGIPQSSFVDLSVLHKFFFFQLIDVVLVSTISGGFFSTINQFEKLVQNPLGIVNILSENLPQASTFFITFVMLQATNQSGQTMLQIVPFLFSFIAPFLATTPRDLYQQKRTCPTVDLGTLIPAQTVIFILGLEYGVISPLILPFVLLFFCLQYFVYLYQFLYVYEIPYETAGLAFPRAIRHIYIGLFISQLTLIGLFAIRKEALGQMILMIVTLILTAFALFYYDRAFKPLFKFLPVSLFEEESQSEKEKGEPVEAYEARAFLKQQLKEKGVDVTLGQALYTVEAYLHPSTYQPEPTVWLPRDDQGIMQKEIARFEQEGIQASDRHAYLRRRLKRKTPKVEIDTDVLIVQQEGMPGALPYGTPNLTHLNDYLRVLSDNYNLADTVMLY